MSRPFLRVGMVFAIRVGSGALSRIWNLLGACVSLKACALCARVWAVVVVVENLKFVGSKSMIESPDLDSRFLSRI